MRYMWREQAESLRVYTEEAMRLNQAQQKFKAIGLSPEENERAFKAVKQTVNTIKGLRSADVMETLTDVHTALGDLEHAIEALPAAAKFRFGFQTIFGEKFSAEELESQIQNAMKYLEVTGSVAKGRVDMEHRFNVIAQMMAATGGRVRPSELLTMARRGGPALQGLSVEGLRNLSAAVQELGGSGTGTSLMSLYQAIIAGVMKQSAATEFQRLGLLDPKKIEFGRAQRIKRLMPGANKLGALLMEDPLKAADVLMEAMRKPLKGAPIDTSNANKVREEMAILFGNRTAQRLMSILTTQRNQVVKEANLSAGAKDIEQLYAQALETPMGKAQQFEAALANLRAEVGGPLLTSLTSLSQAVLPFVKLMGEHPKVTLFGLALFKFASFAMYASAAAQSSGLTRMFGIGRAAEETAVSVGAATTRVARYQGMLRRVPTMVGTTITLFMATEVLALILKYKAEADQAWEEAKAVAEEGKRADIRLLAALPKTPAGIEQFTKINYRGMQTQIGSLLKSWPDLTRLKIGGFFGTSMEQRSKEGAERLRERMPELAIPAVFIEYMRQIQDRKDLSADVKQALINAANLAFPEAGAKYREALDKAQGDVAAAQRALTETAMQAARDAQAASSHLKEGLQSGADAAEDFGRRVRSIPLPGGVDEPTGPPEAQHARGGLTRRRHVATVGESPELILPLSQLDNVLSRMGRGGEGNRIGPFHIDARGAQAGVGAEIKRAVMEAIQESGLGGLTDNGFRNRALST